MVESKQDLKLWVLKNCFRPYAVGDYFYVAPYEDAWLLINMYNNSFDHHEVHLIQGTEEWCMLTELWEQKLRTGDAIAVKDYSVNSYRVYTGEARKVVHYRSARIGTPA